MSISKKNVKSILLDIEFEGNGIVNYDSNDQRFIYMNEEKSLKKSRHKNVSYAKKNFYTGEDGQLIDKLKISSNSLRKSLFEKSIPNYSPNIMHHDAILYSFIASPASIIRGYVFAGAKEQLKRKSALSLTDAEQVCNAVSYLETFTKSGEKVTKDVNDSDADSDTSFFKKETVGNIRYKSTGYIDLQELQFLSCDQTLDRYSFNPDLFPTYKKFLNTRMDVSNLELKYYKLTNSVQDIAEYGALLSPENVSYLTKEILSELLSLNIKRTRAYANIKSLRVKLVSNPLTDTMSDENGWVNISSIEDIEKLVSDLSLYNFYTEVDEVTEAERREMIKQTITDSKKTKTDKKEAKKPKKAVATISVETV